MDRWTNIVEALLKNDYKQRHKSKPIEMTNVAAGTLKRLKGNIRDKKKSRCTEFDNARNLSKSNSPVQLTVAEKKLQKRKEQLMKWKQEKQQKKQIAAEQKKKPFVVGIVHPPLTFAPPPPVPKCFPSTSGRITRSQTAQNEALKKKEQTQSHLKSFAPKNAVFHPKLNIATYPVLNLDVRKDKKSTTQTTTQRAVEVVAKKTSVSKPPVTRSLATKLTKNVKIVMPAVIPQILKESNLNKGDKGTPKKIRSKPKRVQTPRRPLNKHQCSLNKNSGISFPSQENKGIGTSNSSQEQDDNIIDMENVNCDQNATYDLNVTPKNVIPKSESSSEEKLKKQCLNNSILTPEQIRKEAERISPCVILSRGKDNARRELKQKLEEGLISEIGNIESVHHFRQQLDSEIIRMTKLCEIWDEIYEKEQLPESVKEQILSATGQARLLMSQKFQQFSGLVERCAAGEECVGGGVVTPTDLQGFWDMLFIQVENIDLRFIQLEKLKQRDWTEDEKPKQLEKKPISNKNVKKQNKPAAPSRLREMIAVARKAFKERNNSTASVPEEQKANCVLPFSPSPLRRRFSSMLLSSGTPRTPSSDDKLLISSEAQRASARRSLASYAMLRASQISKSVEIEGISPLEQTPKNLTPINLNATPAKSILKSKNNDMSERKLTKTVLFNNHRLDTDTTINSSITDDGKIHTAVTTDIYNQTDENIDVQSQSRMLLEENEVTECISINTDAVEDTGKHNSGTIRRRNKKKSLPRQEAFDEENTNTNKIMTRRRRQSEMADTDSGYIFPKAETEKKNSRSSKKKKALQEIAVNIRQSTDLEGGGDTLIQGKSGRRRQKVSELEDENMIKITPRMANRKIKVSTATEDDLGNFEDILYITPRRSSRKRNSKSIV